jgi:hypothetical protein
MVRKGFRRRSFEATAVTLTSEPFVDAERGDRLVSVERARPARSVVDSTVTRHDLLLLTLPVPLLASALAGVLTRTPLHLSVGAGSLPAALLVAYGLFVDAPAPVTVDGEGDDGSTVGDSRLDA